MTIEDVFSAYEKTAELFPGETPHASFALDKEINDKAYYVMLFAQFERYLDDMLETFLEKEELKTFYFTEKVEALNVPEESDTTASIKRIYGNRCLIAHGADFNGPIHIVSLYHELIDLQGQIGNWLDENVLFEETDD